jgi:hypothetical protein
VQARLGCPCGKTSQPRALAPAANAGKALDSRTPQRPPPQPRHPLPPARLPPDDAVPGGGELLEREYVLAPGAALMLEGAVRPPLETLTGTARASAVYSRLGEQ